MASIIKAHIRWDEGSHDGRKAQKDGMSGLMGGIRVALLHLDLPKLVKYWNFGSKDVCLEALGLKVAFAVAMMRFIRSDST